MNRRKHGRVFASFATCGWALLIAALATVAANGKTPAVESSNGVREILRMPGVASAYPRWSKDGSRILFQSNRSGKWQVYVMNTDGSHQRQLTTDPNNNNFVDWSGDNSKIAFVSDRTGNEEVFVMNVDGSGLRQLTHDSGRDIHPYFAPDGKSLLFNSNRDDEAAFEIYRVNLDGSGLTRLTTTKDVETCARLSPVGGTMVFLDGDPVAGDEVYLMAADGSHRVNLTKSKAA
jgi:TolB protein